MGLSTSGYRRAVRRPGAIHRQCARRGDRTAAHGGGPGQAWARNISAEETGQLLRNAHVLVRNPREPTPGRRRLLIGRTDGRRRLPLVIEKTVEATTWLGITGWESTEVERKLLPG